jgi:SAM-dependent methyltransferase
MIDTISGPDFACPICKGRLEMQGEGLRCAPCELAIPEVEGILDFTVLPEGAGSRREPALKRAYAAFFNLIAPIYESWGWYQLTLNLSGARESSIASIARFVGETLEGTTGAILDVACGPATYGRRIAAPSRPVVGVDLSPGMLRQGRAFLEREGISNVRLARARVERLPFSAGVFDGAICAGSLHLFPDPAQALGEIARTLKDGAPIAIQTFLLSKKESSVIKDRIGYHSYEELELRRSLAAAGFEALEASIVGTVLMMRAKKKQ